MVAGIVCLLCAVGVNTLSDYPMAEHGLEFGLRWRAVRELWKRKLKGRSGEGGEDTDERNQDRNSGKHAAFNDG
jgi:hypothetical protein